jgi:hypothetical protein
MASNRRRRGMSGFVLSAMPRPLREHKLSALSLLCHLRNMLRRDSSRGKRPVGALGFLPGSVYCIETTET